MYNSSIILYSSCPVQHTKTSGPQASISPKKKKMFLVEWQATHAPFPSLLGHWWNCGLSNHLWVDQTGDRRSQIRTIWKMFQHLKVQLAANFNGMGSSVWTGIFMQHGRTFWQQFSTFVSNNWFQLVLRHFTIMDIAYCCAPLLLLFQNWPLCILKKCQQHPYHQWLSFELLFQQRMSDVCTTCSGVCFLECNGGSTSHPHDTSFQKSITFIMIVI
jgi:hypothetical protein